jgi:hypothetical protein
MYGNSDPTGVFLSRKALMSLHPEVRAAVLRSVFQEGPAPETSGDGEAEEIEGEEPAITGQAADDEAFAELSPRQARRFYEGCGGKTKAAVEAMAKSESRFFQVRDVAKAVGVTAPELRGVWGGLTRRVKTITNDHESYLVNWAGSEPKHDAEGNYVDQRGELTEMTYQSFRKALSL